LKSALLNSKLKFYSGKYILVNSTLIAGYIIAGYIISSSSVESRMYVSGRESLDVTLCTWSESRGFVEKQMEKMSCSKVNTLLQWQIGPCHSEIVRDFIAVMG
jgi:hypothetical protein